METDQKDVKKLEKAAKKAMENSYTTVYGFPVGASVLTSSGEIYSGCVVDGMVNGNGTCAEQNAITSAVSNGEYSFKAVYVTAEKSDSIRPCGNCLQFIAEFAKLAENNTEIIMDRNGENELQKINEILPETVNPRNLDKDIEEYI
ncbi:MAG: cytidine deaminase [Candidatus Nanohaloarchaea archaeon]|jgi:cytidine deaminase